MYEPEKVTRKKRIDQKLRPHWPIVPFEYGLNAHELTHHAVEEYETENGPADYALFVNGKLLAIIEAKKVSVAPQAVMEQSKRYGSPTSAPFLYSTNGEVIWFKDNREENSYQREVAAFHTPQGLWDMYTKDAGKGKEYLANAPVDNPYLRPYQKAAIQAVEERLADNKRIMLVAMATGTGKTFTTINQIYRLLESKAYKRILFLVDRRALAAQAASAFSAFETPHGNKFNQEYEIYTQRIRRTDLDDEERDQLVNFKELPLEYLTNPTETHTFVYVSTIQRLAVGLFGKEAVLFDANPELSQEEDAEKLDIPIHAFDLVIADECHRGYTAKQEALWRKTLDHFDAVKIGLTATPAQHTIHYFKEIAYKYSVEEAIEGGYLVDYEAVKINSGVRMNGVFLQPGERVTRVDTETGVKNLDELEDERAFSTGEIEQKITVPDSNRKIIEELKKYALKHEEETGDFPKTLIFAANDVSHTSHADQLVQLCREIFGRGDDFVQKITGNPNVDRPLKKIKQFRNRPEPKIVVTVDMLSTGVDIPKLEFIVMLRPVKSRILWEQMLGRGTRLCPEINKTHFKVFDCFDGTLFEYFKSVTGFDDPVNEQSTTSLKEVIDNIYNNNDRNYFTGVLVKRLQRIDKQMSGEARDAFKRFIPDGDMKAYASNLWRNLEQDFMKTIELLQNAEFQNLLLNYPRAKKVFIIADGVVDTVSSDLVHTAGSFQRATDYLEEFEKYIDENKDKVQALQILTSKPADWNPEVLSELRAILAGTKFREDTLTTAYRKVYHKDLVDIISAIKFAAKSDDSLLSLSERVDKAMEAIKVENTFTDEQLQWLEYVRNHITQNLSLDEEQIGELPPFTLHGGIYKAKELFGDNLNTMINSVNYSVVSV